MSREAAVSGRALKRAWHRGKSAALLLGFTQEKLLIVLVQIARMKVDNGLSRFRGCVDSKDASDLLAYVEGADFSKVDKEDI